MPPRRWDATDVGNAALAQFDLLAAWAEGADLTRPTRLGDWTVAELVAHCANNIRAVHRYLVRPGGTPTLTVLDYLGAMRDVAPAVAQRAHEQAISGHASIAEETATARAALAAMTAEEIAARTVDARLGTLPLSDFLVTRCVEGVVHGLDLLAALDRPPAADPAALKIVTRALADLLVTTAPGKAVEVRVPGPAGVAVQCGDGPRHTRGTPGNVVETDPVTFVELCSGRVTWADAGSRLDASGNRADLSPYLPLLR